MSDNVYVILHLVDAAEETRDILGVVITRLKVLLCHEWVLLLSNQVEVSMSLTWCCDVGNLDLTFVNLESRLNELAAVAFQPIC